MIRQVLRQVLMKMHDRFFKMSKSKVLVGFSAQGLLNGASSLAVFIKTRSFHEICISFRFFKIGCRPG